MSSAFHHRWHQLVISTMVGIWMLLSLSICWPIWAGFGSDQPEFKAPVPGGVNYLIVAPQALSKSAAAWAAYRRQTGYQTRAVLLLPDQVKVEDIRDIIQQTYVESGNPFPFFVLLLGHSHPLSSYPTTFLPAPHFSVDPNQFSGYGTKPIPSDDGYIRDFSQGITGSELPIFMGRIPARTEQEAQQLLVRMRSNEESPPTGPGRARIELITSDAGFGRQYDPVFDWAINTLIQNYLPLEYQWHLLSGNPNSPYSYPIEEFPQEVARRLSSGALAVVYIGHGQPDLLGWAYSLQGERNRVFQAEDVRLIQDASASLAIFTACSAGQYDLNGDDLSVVESIYLAPAGPVATYSSSAWINGTLNGRLVIDIFESLLIDRPPTLGEWVARVEAGSHPVPGSHTAFTWSLSSIIPRISGIYENKLLLSASDSRQILAIQHASYNLFGDPALEIAYPQAGIQLTDVSVWKPWLGSLTLVGQSSLPAGQIISLSLEALPGKPVRLEASSEGDARYDQANNPVVNAVVVTVKHDGSFSAKIDIPSGTPNGRYLLRATSVSGHQTISSARSIYLGWSVMGMILSSQVFWWFIISGFLLLETSRRVRSKILSTADAHIAACGGRIRLYSKGKL